MGSLDPISLRSRGHVHGMRQFLVSHWDTRSVGAMVVGNGGFSGHVL